LLICTVVRDVVTFTLLGLGLGAIYALAAQGIVLIYRGSGVLNFAHGAMGMVGAFVYADLRDDGWGGVPALIAGVVACAVLGALTQVIVIGPLGRASALTRMVASLGLLTVLQQICARRYGNQQRFVTGFLPSGSVRFPGDVSVTADRLWLLAIGCVSTAALWWVSRSTRFGLATAAVAENPRAIRALGWSASRLAITNWALGAALSGLSTILLLPIVGLRIDALVFLVIPALAASLLGSFSSFPVTLAAGVLIGVVESLLTNPEWVTKAGVSKAAPFVIIIVTLVLRGASLPGRSAVADRLPALGTGRIRPAVVVVLTAAAALGLQGVPITWADAAITALVTALICLSIIVVTGYGGQLSLAQFALAGMGAFIAARTADVWNFPFPLALLAGVVGTIPVGLLVAIPALRTRGVNLAIATLGMALVIERVILSDPELTGGFAGTNVATPSLFGIRLDAIEHPERYALLCLVAVVLFSVAVANIRRGRVGRRLVAVRQNERAAAALGIDVTGVKLYAFAVASAIAALGGILASFRTPNIIFTGYTAFGSVLYVVQTVIGGIGFIGSAIVAGIGSPGGLIDLALKEFTGWDRWLPLATGVLLLITLATAPDGVIANMVRGRSSSPKPSATSPTPAGGRTNAARPRGLRPSTALRVRGASVRFGGVVALDGVDLAVEPGEVVGLIGPNGAGKTTLIDAVSGLTRLEAGTVSLGDVCLDSCSPAARARHGLSRSFQSLELFDEMTVRDNIRTAAESRDRSSYLLDLVRPGRHDPVADERVDSVVAMLGLEADLDRRPSELAFGRRRLVGLARALGSGPSVLMLDEPAAGLDEQETRELGHVIRTVAAQWEIGVLLVEHDMSLVFSVCDRVTAMQFGRVIASGRADDVRNDPIVVAAYLGTEADT
jgi:ABC-type branched-subunit amino acid transport system ATPase component/branched-subunit amino acid ABC-type transport system permease component